jgi:CDP-diacylglycerol--serine O-phosphatidyltransferase
MPIRRPRLRPLPVNSLIPNMLTVISLCAGLTSIRLSLSSEWELAVLAIVVAGIMDGLDGRLARLLKGVTRFGAELDSFADFLSFGVAPVILLYQWTLSGLGGIGWIVVLTYPVCCALRLARFNTDIEAPSWASGFFVGLPAPAAAGLAILPLIANFQFGWALLRAPALVAPFVVILSLLMVSRVPTISFKRLRVRREHVLPLLVVVGLGMAALTSYPWITLSALALSYASTIPVTVFRYSRLARRHAGTARPAAAEPSRGAKGIPAAADTPPVKRDTLH